MTAAMTERRVDTSPQFRAVASGMNLSLDLSHKAASPLRSPPVHVGGTSSQPYSSPPPSGARLTPKPVAIDMPSRAMLTRTSRGLRTVRAYQRRRAAWPGKDCCTYAVHVPASGVLYDCVPWRPRSPTA